VELAETLNNASISVSGNKKEADIAIGILYQIEKLLDDSSYAHTMGERINRSITNYLHLKDEEIVHCIKNIPSKAQLLGKEHIGPKDDIDLREKEASKPVWEDKSKNILKNVEISTTAEEYIRKHKDRLGELYEIMSEEEVKNLLIAGRKYYPIAASIDEVVENIIQNLRTWKKKDVAISGEESFKKEKSIVNMLVEAKKKLETFSKDYKNYYETLYDEINSVDPDALIPDKGPKIFSEMRDALIDSEYANKSGTIPKCSLVNPLITVEVLLQYMSRI